MSEKHSVAATKRWSKVSKAERSKRMSALRTNHLNSLSDKQKKNIGKKLTQARMNKEN